MAGLSSSYLADSESEPTLEISSVDGMSTDQSSDTTVVSLLSKLRSPPPSDLARKRKVRQNPPPPKGVKRGKGTVLADPKNVKPADRVLTYPEECLTVSNKKLFCSACREELATKKSVIESHIKSQKHERGKKRLSMNSQQGYDIAQALKKFDDKFHPEGERLPESTRIYRVKVVTAMLKARCTTQ